MMRAIKMAIAAVGLTGATVVIAPAPACAQVFLPAFAIVPYYNYYYYYPTYQPAFWEAYGYSGHRPLWRRYHPYGYYRSPSRGWDRRHNGFHGGRYYRHAGVYGPYGGAYGFHRYPRLGLAGGFARFRGHPHAGSRGHRWYGRAGFGRRAGGYGIRGHGVGGVHR
jgi:hypothetical protein